MKNIHRIFILCGIMVLCACSRNRSYQLISQTDSLLYSHPDSALKILDGISNVGQLSEEGIMHYSWNYAMAHLNMGMSLEEDTMTLDAVDYYRRNGNKEKDVEGYLLEGFYLNWKGKTRQAVTCLDMGYAEAMTQKDASGALRILEMKIGILSCDNQYSQVAFTIREFLKTSKRLSLRESSKLTYLLAENLSLLNDPSASGYYEQAIKMAKFAGDTDMACEMMRNYSSSLCVAGNYRKSNRLLFEIRRLNPELFHYSVILMSVAENYVNLHLLDSARVYIDSAKKSEARLQAEGQSNLNRQASIDRISYLLNYHEGKPVSSIGFNRYCDSVTTAMINKDNTSLRRLETKNRLLLANHELHDSLQSMAWWIISLVLMIAATVIGIYLFYKNRYRKLAEAEDSIETLKRMLTEAQLSTEETQGINDEADNAFFKKILLQQLGIIRLVAGTPTNQNQALLRRISGIGGGEIPTDSLLIWTDLYPVIDSLYDKFHSRLISEYGGVLTEKEVQICCLLCAGFSTKEIGVITQQTNATIYVRKTSIRKKIGAVEGEDIVEHVNTI
jgi:DNA-binding CsgD family transcriptional regulator